MTDEARDPADYCYRHPDRRSYVLCQRCGRTICPECQTQAAVGVHCPECTREARASAPKQRPALLRAARSSSGRPIVTWSIIGITLFVFALQLLIGNTVINELAYVVPLTYEEPWRMLTAALVHSNRSFLHVLFNMYSLFIFGPMLESMLGRSRFVALYVLSAIGGSVAVLLSAFTPFGGSGVVVGASGAIFGLLGAYFVIARRLGGNAVQLLIVIGLNLAIGFIVPGIAWQAHIGGLIVGALVGWIFTTTRGPRNQSRQRLLIGAVVAGLVLLTLAPLAFANVLA